MEKHYTAERNTQILIYLMKQYGVRKVVASPGTTNIAFVGSIQNDPFFEVYSSVDERSAAYIACGLAAESGEPVALSCTGATASRNYLSGLTEAYYSKLPILAITSTQSINRIGQLVAQVIDRTNVLNDVAKVSVQVRSVKSQEDEWACENMINRALIELTDKDSGPVHINLETIYDSDFSLKEIKPCTVIKKYWHDEKFAEIEAKRTVVFLGQHRPFDKKTTLAIESFCEKYNAVVIGEHISNYKGKYYVNATLLSWQTEYTSPKLKVDLMIHIGNVSGFAPRVDAKEVWRVNIDGEVRDCFKKLTKVFKCDECSFFEKYNEMKPDCKNTEYFNELNIECQNVYNKVPELPFSNPWIAQHTISRLPGNSVLHLGILNSLRSWNLFNIKEGINVYSNTGGFGIDGIVSSLIGASLVDNSKLYFGILGDLACFYDLNAFGNRHISNNIRIMIVNNGKGTEFTNFNHPAARFGDDANKYMAAAGHYGNKSKKLLKDYVENLGFKYICAENKADFADKVSEFLDDSQREKPYVFEVFTSSEDESKALQLLYSIEKSTLGATKGMVKKIIGEKGVSALRKVLS